MSGAAHHEAARLSQVGFWGPQRQAGESATSAVQAEVSPLTPVDSAGGLRAGEPARARGRKAWGLGDVAWAGLAFLVSQVVFGIALLTVALVDQAHASPAGAGSVPGVGAQAGDAVTRAGDLASTGAWALAGLGVEWLIFLGVPYLAARRKGAGSLAVDFGLRVHRRDVLTGPLLAVTLQVFLAGVNVLLPRMGVDLTGADNTSLVTGSAGWWLVAMVAAAAVGAPIAEEVFFRGLFLRALLRRLAKVDLVLGADAQPVGTVRRRVGVMASVVFSAVVFGALHWPSAEGVSTTAAVALVSQTGLLGLVFGVVAVRTRRVGVTVCAHMAFNAISIALALVNR